MGRRPWMVCLAISLSACGDHDAPVVPRAPVPEPSTIEASGQLDPPASAGAIGMSPVAAGDDIIATWVEPADGDVHRVRFATLDATTNRWGEASTVRESEQLVVHGGAAPLSIRLPSGVYYVAMLQRGRDPEASSIQLARSADGVQWTAAGTLHDDTTETEHGQVALTLEGGAARAVWVDGREMATGGPMTLRTARIGPDGSLTDATVLDGRVCECCQTTTVSTTDGPLVAYRDRSESEVRDIFVVRRDAAGWPAPANVYADGWVIPGCPVNGPAAASADRRVALAWYTAGDSGARVRIAFSDDAGARFGLPHDVDASSPVGRLDVEWTDGGEAVVSWLAPTDREREASLRLARVAPDGRVGAALEVSRTGVSGAGGVPRLARIGPDLLVSWTEVGPPTRLHARRIRTDDLAPPTSAAPAPSGGRVALQVGSALPDLVLTDLQGHPVSFASLRGRPIVLSFFATWCAPCRDEYPLLTRLAREHGDRVQVIGVSVDDADLAALANFARAQELGYTVLDADDRAMQVFGVPPIPATYVFDAHGVLTYRRVGGGPELQRELPEAVAAVVR